MTATTDSLWPLLVTVLLVLLALPLLAVVGMAVMMGSMGWMMGAPVATPWWWLIPPLALLLVAGGLAFVLLARRDPSLEALRTAYARGELSDDEFERRMERLSRRG